MSPMAARSSSCSRLLLQPSEYSWSCVHSFTARNRRWLLWQVYAPFEDSDAAFHRMLYLFLSPHSERLAGANAARVLRCQLPRHNAFYSPDPPASRQPPPLPVPALSRDCS